MHFVNIERFFFYEFVPFVLMFFAVLIAFWPFLPKDDSKDD